MNTSQIYKSIGDAARNGNIDKLNRLFSKNTDQNLRSHALAHASHQGQLECVKFLVPQCCDYEVYISGLVSAIHSNQLECINYLLPFFTQPFDCSLALNKAAAADNVELVKHFIALCNQKCGSLALTTAMYKGNREIFDLLLTISDPTDWDHVLVDTVEANRPEFFDIMLPLSDPTYDIYAAFRRAVELGYTHFSEVLYPLVDLQVIDEYLSVFEPDMCEEYYKNLAPLEAKMQKDVLNDNIGEQTPKTKGVARKM